MLRAQLPERWRNYMDDWLCSDFGNWPAVQQTLDLSPTCAGDNEGNKVAWDLFKCSFCVEPFLPSMNSRVQSLTFQLENRVARNFLPVEEEACQSMSNMLQEVEREVFAIGDTLLQPLVESSERLYWSRSRPTSFFSSEIFFKRTDEWTNFYMAMDSRTVALCAITVYGQFEHQDHVYANRVRCIKMPFSLQALKFVEAYITQQVGEKDYSGIVCDSPLWVVIKTRASTNHDHSKQNQEGEEGLAETMQRCCTLMDVSRAEPIAELSTREVFRAIERIIYDAEKHAYEQNNAQGSMMRTIFDDISDDLRNHWQGMTASDYVEQSNASCENWWQCTLVQQSCSGQAVVTSCCAAEDQEMIASE